MTASVADAEDVTQEVLIKVVTRLDTFRGDASLSTWTYRIAVRHILDRRRGRVEVLGLDFDAFGADLMDGLAGPDTDDEPALAEEVKLGCTLAMLTCLDREHRVAYILGEVFDLPGQVAADISDVSPEVHRQRLSRAKRQLEGFTTEYCGIVNPRAPCSCDRRVKRAIQLGRLERENPVFSGHPRRDARLGVREMESLHATAALFRGHPDYRAPEFIAQRIRDVLDVEKLAILRDD
jgi:RNA polymerase sigma factor (sigma-70 family)